jgi:hypothetical protein
MKIFVTPRRDEIGKFQGVIQAFPEIWKYSVLDVGCRSGNLKQVLPDNKIQYWGVDLHQPADVIGSLEDGLPFRNQEFYSVVALDVLEHTDNIYGAFGELCRIAQKYVVITFPNAYEIQVRFRFLFGKNIGGKYGLPLKPPHDRHRWIFSFDEARNFTHSRASKHGFSVLTDGCLIGPRRAILARKIVRLLPNLASSTYVALLGRSRGVRSGFGGFGAVA